MNRPGSLRLLAAAAALAVLLSCEKPPAATQKEKPVPPVKVDNGGVKEADLATITLSPKAEERLGIQTATIEYGPALRSETLAGEVVIPPGQSLTVTAPVAGSVDPAGRLVPGTNVAKGQALFRLLPLVPAQRDLKVSAEAELASARTRFEAAKLRASRAEQMLKDRVGSLRALEDARQELDLAETAVKTAEARIEQLKRAPLDADVAMTIASPLAGILRQVHAAAGQQVAAGAVLAEVVRVDPIWIRVPVYAGQLDAFVRGASARVSMLGSNGSGYRAAKPVAAPPSADPLAATADLFFELPNANLSLRPGQKVNATLPLRGNQRVLKAPASSILYDLHGGAWLYLNTAPHTFVRRRVEIAEMQGPIAILRVGPPAGTRVVTVGGAELFGTEFGVGK